MFKAKKRTFPGIFYSIVRPRTTHNRNRKHIWQGVRIHKSCQIYSKTMLWAIKKNLVGLGEIAETYSIKEQKVKNHPKKIYTHNL